MVDTWISSLPSDARGAVLAFADPHPPGARARAIFAATALYEVARAWPSGEPGLQDSLKELSDQLLAAGQGTSHQPGVRNMVRYMLSVDFSGRSEDVAERLSSRLEEARQSVTTASQAMASTGAALLNDGDRILVHDFADRSTQAVVTAAAKQGKRLDVVATACRSRRADGVRVAKESLAVGHRATVVTDAGVAWVMEYYGIQRAFVGADAVMDDGTVLTTPGAHVIAVVGQTHGVPVHVVTDLWKLLDSLGPEMQAVNEQPDADGVPEAQGWAELGYGFLNPLVDITPGRYLTSFITEFGELEPATVGDVARAKYGFGTADPVPTAL
jgi:methylthioribose-1-phosphate isomerase